MVGLSTITAEVFVSNKGVSVAENGVTDAAAGTVVVVVVVVVVIGSVTNGTAVVVF